MDYWTTLYHCVQGKVDWTHVYDGTGLIYIHLRHLSAFHPLGDSCLFLCAHMERLNTSIYCTVYACHTLKSLRRRTRKTFFFLFKLYSKACQNIAITDYFSEQFLFYFLLLYYFCDDTQTQEYLQLSISKVQFCSSSGYLRRSIMQAAVVVILKAKMALNHICMS